ncbi:MAG: hypothetical protein U1F81_22045 [Verrucomicrobiaceae bacterium]
MQVKQPDQAAWSDLSCGSKRAPMQPRLPKDAASMVGYFSLDGRVFDPKPTIHSASMGYSSGRKMRHVSQQNPFFAMHECIL